MKKRIEYKKMYYGFPVILIAFYDDKEKPNITTLSSSFSLGDMIVLGFGSNSYAATQIKNGNDFTVNIPDSSLMKEIDMCGAHSGHVNNKFELTNLAYEKSTLVNAPIIKKCPISIECTPINITESEEFEGYTTVFAKVKGRLVSTDLLDEDNNLIYKNIDSIEYVGDDHLRVYRYLDKNKTDDSRSFLR